MPITLSELHPAAPAFASLVFLRLFKSKETTTPFGCEIFRLKITLFVLQLSEGFCYSEIV